MRFPTASCQPLRKWSERSESGRSRSASLSCRFSEMEGALSKLSTLPRGQGDFQWDLPQLGLRPPRWLRNCREKLSTSLRDYGTWAADGIWMGLGQILRSWSLGFPLKNLPDSWVPTTFIGVDLRDLRYGRSFRRLGWCFDTTGSNHRGF